MDRAVGRYMLYAGGMRALKPPFVCCWFDSCLWLQVRGGRSEHLRCQHSHPPTGAAIGYGSERAYPMAGGEWHPAAPSINRTIYRCLLQGFENGLNLQSRESGQMGTGTHKARATSRRARLARLQDGATTEYNWFGTTNIVTSAFRPISVPVSDAAVSIASATEAPLPRLWSNRFTPIPLLLTI